MTLEENTENVQHAPEELEKAKYSFRRLLKKTLDTHSKNVKQNKDTTEVSLTLQYLPFILTRVRKKYLQHHMRYSYDDLLDEAILASLVSEKRYKPALGYDFTTYAKYDIDGALTKFISSLSVTQLTLYNKMLRFIDSYSSKTGKHPSKASILSGLKISEEKYTHLLQDLEPPTIVPYMSITKGGEEVELGVRESSTDSDIVVNDILTIISKLDSPMKEIIEMSVIQEMSIDSIASYLSISKQEAQGKIDSAKADLRDILELHGITG